MLAQLGLAQGEEWLPYPRAMPQAFDEEAPFALKTYKALSLYPESILEAQDGGAER
jgi:hypothetical protein